MAPSALENRLSALASVLVGVSPPQQRRNLPHSPLPLAPPRATAPLGDVGRSILNLEEDATMCVEDPDVSALLLGDLVARGLVAPRSAGSTRH